MPSGGTGLFRAICGNMFWYNSLTSASHGGSENFSWRRRTTQWDYMAVIRLQYPHHYCGRWTRCMNTARRGWRVRCSPAGGAPAGSAVTVMAIPSRVDAFRNRQRIELARIMPERHILQATSFCFHCYLLYCLSSRKRRAVRTGAVSCQIS